MHYDSLKHDKNYHLKRQNPATAQEQTFNIFTTIKSDVKDKQTYFILKLVKMQLVMRVSVWMHSIDSPLNIEAHCDVIVRE